MQLTIDLDLPERLSRFVADPRAVDDLRTYYQEGAPNTGYTGRWFEQIGSAEERRRTRNVLTGEDIVAVSALSVRLPITVSCRLLVEDSAEISALLTDIPADVDLWQADTSMLSAKSAAGRLHAKLRSMAWNGGDSGTAWVTAGKLMARKRPRLIPIYDRQVKDLVGLSKKASWWLSLHAALTDDLRDHLDQVRRSAGLDPAIPPLRALDVILWMRARR